jgi:hypothetical protein
MAQLDAKFIEKFNENPRFEVPKAPKWRKNRCGLHHAQAAATEGDKG